MELGSKTGEGLELAVGSGGIREAVGCQEPQVRRRGSQVRDDLALCTAGVKGLAADGEEGAAAGEQVGSGAGGCGTCTLYVRQRHHDLEQRSARRKSVFEENYFSSCSCTEKEARERLALLS